MDSCMRVPSVTWGCYSLILEYNSDIDLPNINETFQKIDHEFRDAEIIQN